MTGPPTSGGDDGHDRELVAGTLRGYRIWRVVPRGIPLEPEVLPLASVTRPLVTWPRALSASCTSVDFGGATRSPPRQQATHRAPTSECRCGIYAWYSPAEARTLSAEVFGVVEASGLVLLGTRGFRAEHVRITAVATRNRRVAEACGEAGIAVYSRRRDLVADHPPDDVSILVGEDDEPSRGANPKAFALVICLSVWLRAAILVMAAGLLPPAAVIATLVISELAVLGLVVRHLGHTPKLPRG